MRARRLVVAAALLAACPAPSRSRADWGDLPRGPAAAEAAVRRHTMRDPAGLPRADLSAEALLALPALDRGEGTIVAGEAAVAEWIDGRLGPGSPSALLVGTYHDSPGQVRAFRRLVGPSGVPSIRHVVLEQLRADGRWAGPEPEARRGDDRAVAEYLATGRTDAWRSLAGRVDAHAYTAWRYGAVGELMDVIAAARAAGQGVGGCDMPPEVQARTGAGGPLLDSLRELHCWLALQEVLDGPSPPGRVAMLWGMDHVRAAGLPRFLPDGMAAVSLYVVGERPGALAPEARLADRLTVNDQVLLPIGPSADAAVLLLPGPPLGGEVERSREEVEGAAGSECGVEVSSEVPATLVVADRRVEVGPEPRELPLPAGRHAYLLVAGDRRVVGGLELPAGARAELVFDPMGRATRLVLQLRTPALRDAP